MQNFFKTTDSPIFSVDFDYFRLPREKWELMLTRLRQMGFKTLNLTLPWRFHEFSRGTVDLTGSTTPRHNVVDLIKLAVTLNFHVILQPGPYAPGILEEGIPPWLLHTTTNFEAELPTAVEGWYKALSKSLAAYQWPDGPIIAIHINSETKHQLPPTHSKQLTEVKWRIWLRKRYSSIEALNEAYDSNYRIINDVKFPESWSQESNPLEQDAREFLEKVRDDTQAHYAQLLNEAGWAIPIYPAARHIHPTLPPFESLSLLQAGSLPAPPQEAAILNFQHPIQVDREPVEVGPGPTWAAGAPIRADGSVRQQFWAVRRYLWPRLLANTNTKNHLLVVPFATSSLVTGGQAAPVKLEAETDPPPVAYRLRMNGEVIADEGFKIRRKKLSGSYLAEDETDQTDLLIVLADPAAPLSDFQLTYLRTLLTGQLYTLQRCALLAEGLGQSLTRPPEEPPRPAPPEPPVETLDSLEEARRSLSDADAALKKAMHSISGLEEGFSIILGKSGPQSIPQPAMGALDISPEIFKGPAREILTEAGLACLEIVPTLQEAITPLQRTLDAPGSFTLAKYQHSYTTAAEAVRTARQPLLEVIVHLRREIATENLPLITWSIHDQVQEIAQHLYWGVLRGTATAQ